MKNKGSEKMKKKTEVKEKKVKIGDLKKSNVSDSNKTQQSLEKKVRKITVVLEVVAGFLINFQLKIPTIIIGHLRILGYLNAYLKVFGPILTWSVSN